MYLTTTPKSHDEAVKVIYHGIEHFNMAESVCLVDSIQRLALDAFGPRDAASGGYLTPMSAYEALVQWEKDAKKLGNDPDHPILRFIREVRERKE